MNNLISLLTRVLAAVLLVAGAYLAAGFMKSALGTGDVQATEVPCDGSTCHGGCGVYGDQNLCGVCALFPEHNPDDSCDYIESDTDGDGIENAICHVIKCGIAES